MPAAEEEKHDSKSKMDICGETKVKEAVNALKVLNKKFVETNLKKQPLLEDTSESPIYLQFMLKKIPPPQLLRMIRVPLPHSLVAEASEVCLITGDLEKHNHKAEIEPTVLYYKDLLKKHGITKVTQIIPLRQLRTEYKTFESKRQLAAAYDVFLVDKKIAGVMAKTLGKSFLQNRKLPIQIDMRRPNLKDQIDKALCYTEFSLTCRGNSYALEVARLSMEDESIVENTKACIKVLENKLPGNKENILSLYLKTGKSKAIPIYVSLDIPDNILIKKPRKNDKFKLDELSTIDNAEVKVFRDGRVILRKTKKESSNCEDKNDIKMNLNKPFLDDDILESEEDTEKSLSKETSLKKKKKKASDLIKVINDSEIENEESTNDAVNVSRKKLKKNKKSVDLVTINSTMENEETIEDSTVNKISPKKKKKGKKYASADETTDIVELENEDIQDSVNVEISPKKKKKGKKYTSAEETTNIVEKEKIQDSASGKISPKKKRKGKKYANVDETIDIVELENEENQDSVFVKISPKKKRKDKKYASADETINIFEPENEDVQDSTSVEISPKKKKGRKSILGQVSEKTKLNSEGETKNSFFSHTSSNKNKKNKDSSYVEADVIIDVQDSMFLDSKKRKICFTDNALEKAQKDKKRKVLESEDNNEIDKNIKPKTLRNISEITGEELNETTLKSKKEKKKAKGDPSKMESSFISIKGDQISPDEKTPLRFKKNKKVKKETIEYTAANNSLMEKRKEKVNVDSNLVKLNKRRKSDRKSISAI